MSEHDGITRARATAALSGLRAAELRAAVEAVAVLARLELEHLRAVIVIASRLRAGAVESTRRRADANRGQVECNDAVEVLDARIASVVELLRHGQVRGRALPAEVMTIMRPGAPKGPAK